MKMGENIRKNLALKRELIAMNIIPPIPNPMSTHLSIYLMYDVMILSILTITNFLLEPESNYPIA